MNHLQCATCAEYLDPEGEAIQYYAGYGFDADQIVCDQCSNDDGDSANDDWLDGQDN